MTVLAIVKKTEISCPNCNTDALYRYGKTKSGRQRFLCLMCGRQFSQGTTRTEVKGKPVCSECGSIMHLYKIEGNIIRFRCSNYPECKTFKKYRIQEEGNGVLHP